MLKKLKIKFVLINMCLAGIVLLLAVSIVCYNNYKQDKSELDRALEMAINDTLEDKAVPLEIGRTKKDMEEPVPPVKGVPEYKPFNYAAVVAYAEKDDDGRIKASVIGNRNASMSEEMLQRAVDIVFDDGQHEVQSAYASRQGESFTGKIEELDLFYKKTASGDGEKIAFVDSAYFDSTLRQNITTAAILFTGGMVILLFISLFLSKLALSPVKRAWKQQQQFVADASHELKTPLTVILANNDILSAHGEERIDEQRKWIESTQEEAVHMKNLVDDLLFLAQSDEDIENRRLVKSGINFSDMVTDISLQFEPVIFEKGISLDTEIENDIIMDGDNTQIKQLLHILLDNASKYAGDGGSIHLKLFRAGGKIRLTVSNTGIPVSDEDLKHIFERFYRSDKARTREGGYGLGLSIAKTIAENHSGKITAENSCWAGPQGKVPVILITCTF